MTAFYKRIFQITARGSSSMAECSFAKAKVGGSNPLFRFGSCFSELVFTRRKRFNDNNFFTNLCLVCEFNSNNPLQSILRVAIKKISSFILHFRKASKRQSWQNIANGKHALSRAIHCSKNNRPIAISYPRMPI